MSKNMMAVQGFAGDAGATVWWALQGNVYLTQLRAAWEEQGLDPAWLPLLPSAEQRLSRAVAMLTDMRQLRRPIARRGHWAIVEESVGADERLTHVQVLSVKIAYDAPSFVVQHYRGHQLADEIRAAYDEQEGQLTRDDLALWLVEVIRRLHGVPLRPRGGMYYVLPKHVDTWRRVCAAVTACRVGACYMLPTLQSDEATRAVLDALVRDVEDEATTYAEAIGTVGTRALRARVQDCDALLARLTQYDDMLGAALHTVRARVTSVQDAALAAAFRAEAAAE